MMPVVEVTYAGHGIRGHIEIVVGDEQIVWVPVEIGPGPGSPQERICAALALAFRLASNLLIKHG